MPFADNLQKLRKRKGLSQEQLAAQLDVSRQAISRWETGAIPDMENVMKISRFFGYTVEQLMDDQMILPNQPIIKETSSSNPSCNEKKKLRLLPEAVFGAISILSFVGLIVLWILSLIIDYDIVRQDTATGYWYVGFSGFCEYYHLNTLYYALIFLCPACSMAEAYISIIVRNQLSNRNYLIHRSTNLSFCILGSIFSVIRFIQPWKFPNSVPLTILLLLYCSIMIGTGVGIIHYKKAGEKE